MEITAFILQIAVDGISARKLIYKVSYLPYLQLREYLMVLQENGLLIKYERKDLTFITTEKGQNFLQIYAELNDVVAMTNSGNITAAFHDILLTNAHIVEYAVYYIRYLVTIFRSLFHTTLN
jgi:predicted transcriptional regulator